MVDHISSLMYVYTSICIYRCTLCRNVWCTHTTAATTTTVALPAVGKVRTVAGNKRFHTRNISYNVTSCAGLLLSYLFEFNANPPRCTPLMCTIMPLWIHRQYHVIPFIAQVRLTCWIDLIFSNKMTRNLDVCLPALTRDLATPYCLRPKKA